MAYRGSVIRLPVGTLGLSGSRNPSQLQPGHFSYAEGVSLDGGLIQKEGGASHLNASALGVPSKVISGIFYKAGDALNRDAVFLDNGSILKGPGDGTFGTTLESGLNVTQSPPPYFLSAGGEGVGDPPTLFIFSSVNQVHCVDGDGATTAPIATPAADWTGAGNFPTFGVVHEGRIWAGGNASDPHRIYYSTQTDHQDWTGSGSGSLAVFPGTGERIVGGVSFKGLLILFKYPRGIYIVTTTDPTPANWRVDQLSAAVGGTNQHCIVPIDNDVLYLDAQLHIHLLSATDAFSGITTSDISRNSDMHEFIRDNVNAAMARRAVGVWYPEKKQAIFGLAGLGLTQNNIRLTVDFSVPPLGVRFLTSRRDKPLSLWTRPDADLVYRPVHGDDAGFVWLMDEDARSKEDAAFEFRFETSQMDLSFADPKMASINKTGEFLELVFEPQGDWDLIVQTVWDDVPGPPILYSMGGNGAALGVFALDEDILTSTAIKSIRKRIAGQGRRLKIVASNYGIDDAIAISDFILSFKPTNEKGKR